MDDVIRRARPADAEQLSTLALRSKAHWGYDTAFLEAARADLTVSPESLQRDLVYVLEHDGRALAYYALVVEPDRVLLRDFFVSPEAIGTGLGRRLWDHLVATARASAVAAFQIESDPNADGFYLRMGARRIGDVVSPINPARRLPLLEMIVA